MFVLSRSFGENFAFDNDLMYFVMNRAKMSELGNAWEGCISISVLVMLLTVLSDIRCS